MNDFKRNEVNYFRVTILPSKNVFCLGKGVLMYERRVNAEKCGFNAGTQYF